MSTQGEWETTEAMIQYGGGFAQGLGRLYRQADSENKQRLATTFRELFEKYRELSGFLPTRNTGVERAK